MRKSTDGPEEAMIADDKVRRDRGEARAEADRLREERDEARAEVERLREALRELAEWAESKDARRESGENFEQRVGAWVHGARCAQRALAALDTTGEKDSDG